MSSKSFFSHREKSCISNIQKLIEVGTYDTVSSFQQGQSHIDESVTSDGSWPHEDASETTVLTRHTEFKYVETVF